MTLHPTSRRESQLLPLHDDANIPQTLQQPDGVDCISVEGLLEAS